MFRHKHCIGLKEPFVTMNLSLNALPSKRNPNSQSPKFGALRRFEITDTFGDIYPLEQSSQDALRSLLKLAVQTIRSSEKNLDHISFFTLPRSVYKALCSGKSDPKELDNIARETDHSALVTLALTEEPGSLTYKEDQELAGHITTLHSIISQRHNRSVLNAAFAAFWPKLAKRSPEFSKEAPLQLTVTDSASDGEDAIYELTLSHKNGKQLISFPFGNF